MAEAERERGSCHNPLCHSAWPPMWAFGNFLFKISGEEGTWKSHVFSRSAVGTFQISEASTSVSSIVILNDADDHKAVSNLSRLTCI